MKKILVPTDFTVESLSILKKALENNPNEKLDILLVHGVSFSNAITDLLFFRRHQYIASLENNEFCEANDILKNKFASNINSLVSDVFIGYNLNAFKNYVEGNKIEEAYIPANYNLKKANKDSQDILPYIKKAIPLVHEVNLEETNGVYVGGSLANIFA
ncbi:hypothetical protein U1E44_06260 [Arenibacter sp. GZD96]|uniref:hypothetical protein n=1 Tax=Aurantibrevibacter litoralis TaxID=3106030 RepID=UPI002AFDD360|nr:hypothetical protein [Arenibacter sp. GZD-96]MEA1785685.1 hypothetical protein [Arenibacter sp. GZD-96]